MPTLMEEIRDLFNHSVQHKGGLIQALKMAVDEGNVYYSALFAVYILPLLVIYGFYKLMQVPFSTEDDTVERTKALELANAHERKKIENWIQKHPTLRHKNRKWE